MTPQKSIAKEFSRSRADRLIRVLVPNQKGRGFNATTFPDTEVERIVETGEDLSALVLRSGVEVPVALPYEQLEQKIYEPDFRNDGPVLDLRDVTGGTARPKASANTNQAPAPGQKIAELARSLPEEWRAPFVCFVETGEAEKPFLAFLETNKEAQAAVEVKFKETATAFEKLSAVLRPTDRALRVGDKMPDGSVYAGVSPDTGKAMYTTPADAPLTYTFNRAKEYASKLDAHGHQDWRVPTKAELNVLFNNSAAIGGFAGWYGSASSYHRWTAWAQRFSDGVQAYDLRVCPKSVRCVR